MFSPNDMNISDDVKIVVQPSTALVMCWVTRPAGRGRGPRCGRAASAATAALVTGEVRRNTTMNKILIITILLQSAFCYNLKFLTFFLLLWWPQAGGIKIIAGYQISAELTLILWRTTEN